MDDQPQENIAFSKDTKLKDRIWAFKKMRETYEPMFYLSRRAYEGKHFTYWNKSLQQITEIPMKKSMFNSLPEIAKQTEAYENFLLSTDLSFFVAPKRLSDADALKESMMLSLLARDKYNQLRETTVYADFVHSSMLDNVSFIEVSPNNTLTDVEYRAYDGFDILFNPRIKDWTKQRLVVKVVRKQKDDLKIDKKYRVPQNYVGSDAGEFMSWKDIWEQEKYNNFVKVDTDETVIFECNILEQYTDDKGEKKDRLRIKTLDLVGNILRNDTYDSVSIIPIFPLRIYQGEWYQPSYAYRLIPINRTQDIIANRMDDLFLRLTKGGWIKQEEETIDGGMNEEMGQIINYSATKPEPITMQPVPNFFGEWFNTLLGLSERYGISSILSGNLPAKSSGLRAGKMIDQIKGLTVTNNTATINSLRSVVKQILQATFMYYYEMWNTPQEVIYSDITEFAPKFVSGKKADMYKGDGVIAIPDKFKRFDVDIDNGLGYTLDERKKTAVELNKVQGADGKPLISGETLKKIFKLGSSGYLMEAEDKPMHSTAEFQQLIKDFPTLSPEEQNAVITTLNTVAKQVGNQASNPTDTQALISKMQGQQAEPPKANPNPAPQPQPAPQGGQPAE